ncbi:MAG: cytochrome c biogenesis protein CcdA [Candidatus Omnitrophica bacterium]|nr:cytochrome c biogenesis protein CcdA [Candidatus Omnitrophota bacterium]
METTQNSTLLLSFAAGLLSFASPCILPLIPAYLSYITGASIENLKAGGLYKKNILLSLVFVLGFTAVFTILGASATWLGRHMLMKQEIIRKTGAVIIVLFGLHLAGILKIKPLYRQKRISSGKTAGNYAGAFVIGMVFAFGWTPCVGPVLASILIMASAEESLSRGILLLFFYSMGIGLPFIITALFLNKALSVFTGIKRHYRKIETATGILLIALGILMFFNKFRVFTGL